MNPTAASQSNQNNPASLFEKAFDSQTEFEQPEVENTMVSHTDQAKDEIKNSWAEFYSLRTEDITSATPEKPVNTVEITETRIEVQAEAPKFYEKEESIIDSKPVFAIENQKGSGSWVEDAGFKLDFKSLFKGLFGIFSGLVKDTFKGMTLLKEISMDTVNMVTGKKDKKAEKVDPNPEKAKAAAEKKAEKQKKNANIKIFYEGLKAQMGSVVTAEAVQMETQEKENINKTIKLTNASYKGIKNSFGRLTVYAASMFEREQLDQEKQAKKVEKEQKMASVNKGPDLNLDKAAEGGFLSSTGGQGAG